MNFTIRQANVEDIEQMHIVRMAVRENRLVSTVVTAEDYRSQIIETGRGWVVVVDGEIVGFAIGNTHKCYIWALFITPEFEGRGIGLKLHDEMLTWMWKQGCERIRLTTAPNTRAERFYEKAGWKNVGISVDGEIIFEKAKV